MSFYCFFLTYHFKTGLEMPLTDMKIFFWELMNEAYSVGSTFSVKMNHVFSSMKEENRCEWKCHASIGLTSLP